MNEFTMIGFLAVLSSLATGLPLSEYYNRKETGLRDYIESLSDDELEQLANFLAEENPKLANNLNILKDPLQANFEENNNDEIKKEMILSNLMKSSNKKQLNLKL